MAMFCARNPRKALSAARFAVSTLLVLSFWSVSSTVNAQSTVNIVRIEEDWELVVKEPDSGTQSPHVTCAFSPTGNLDSTYAAFTVNHKTLPDFEAGGMQLQLWSGSDAVASYKFPHDDLLSHSNETVRWTQSMKLTAGLLTYEITDGSSTTWGAFGGQGYLKGTVATTLVNLNGYDSAVSVANSGIGYASNRVTSLTLKKIRATSLTGDTVEDSTPKIVFQNN